MVVGDCRAGGRRLSLLWLDHVPMVDEAVLFSSGLDVARGAYANLLFGCGIEVFAEGVTIT